MGKDQGVELPKYLQGYSDPERRKEWQRNYQRERYHKMKKNRGEIVEVKMTQQNTQPNIEKPEMNVSDGQFGDLIKGFQDVVGKDDDDPVLKTINKYGKYLPLIMKFIQGFTENAQAHQMQQMAQQQRSMAQQNNGPRPPQGWVQMTALQRMDYKYDRAGNITPWYQEGERYDQMVAQGGIEMGVKSHQPIAMERTVHGQRQAQIQNQEATMAELNRRAENERWDKKEGMDLSNAKLVERSDGQPATINEAIGKQEKTEQPADQQQAEQPINAEQALEQIGGALMKDNEKYLGIVIEYFKSRSLKDFEKDLENAEDTIKKFVNTWGWAIPVQTKEMIKRTSIDELKEMLKNSDPAKLELVKKKKLTTKFSKLWSEIQDQIGKDS